jgi:hypothetical protein
VKRLMLLSLVVLFMASPVVADGRRHREPPQGYPFADEIVEGEYLWRPDWRPRSIPPWPRRFTVDKEGRCEVRCERTDGWAYTCRSYRC